MRPSCKTLFGLFVLIVLTTSVAHAQFAQSVGNFADDGRLVIEGAKLMPAEAVVEALRTDFDTMLAAHPMAPLSGYAAMIERRMLSGYKHEGFPDAKVDVKVDQKNGRIVAKVEEGPRYMAGDVVIEGNGPLPVESLIERITKPHPPEDAVIGGFEVRDGKRRVKWVDKNGQAAEMQDPIWEQAKPAHFDKEARKKFHTKVARAFSDFGYHFADFDVDIYTGRDDGMADLLVKINQLGKQAIADEIVITGNNRDSRGEILTYLDINLDEVLTTEACNRIAYRLWRSGRFVKYDVKPVKSPDGRISLAIDLTEYEKCPKLAEELSPAAKTMMKFRDWLANPERWEGDLVVQADVFEQAVEVVMTGDHGLAISLDIDPASAAAKTLRLNFIFCEERLGIYSDAARAKITSVPGKVTAILQGGLQPTEPGDDKTFALQFGMGLKSRDQDEIEPPFIVDLTYAPAAFIGMARMEHVKYAFDGGTMIATSDWGTRLTVDAETGRLIEMILRNEDGKRTGHIRFEKGAFERRVHEIDIASRDYANIYDKRRPLSSWLTFLLKQDLVQHYCKLEPKYRRAMGVMSKLLDGGVMQPIDDLLRDEFGCDEEEDFEIPADQDLIAAQMIGNPVALVPRMALPYYAKLFPGNSWPLTVGREAMLAAAGQTQYTVRVVASLIQSQDNGPLCFLVTGSLLERVNPPAAGMFARVGMEKLSVEDFRKDLSVLLDPKCASGRSAVLFGKALRSMDAEDVEALDRALFGEADVLAECAKRLRKNRKAPIAKVLAETLEDLWPKVIRGKVETALKDLQERNTIQ